MGKCDYMNLKKQMKINYYFVYLVQSLFNATFIVFLFSIFSILTHGDIGVIWIFKQWCTYYYLEININIEGILGIGIPEKWHTQDFFFN